MICATVRLLQRQRWFNVCFLCTICKILALNLADTNPILQSPYIKCDKTPLFSSGSIEHTNIPCPRSVLIPEQFRVYWISPYRSKHFWRYTLRTEYVFDYIWGLIIQTALPLHSAVMYLDVKIRRVIFPKHKNVLRLSPEMKRHTHHMFFTTCYFVFKCGGAGNQCHSATSSYLAFCCFMLQSASRSTMETTNQVWQQPAQQITHCEAQSLWLHLYPSWSKLSFHSRGMTPHVASFS